ncbi:anti-sigma factor [Stakelama sediminis]|uniref:Anti-sigma factor n=1 Tax=Stakelama sediminis TaxID=463200 RepID=A0A840YWF9_9SPHN|nr:anti-sigma factor [Stakelama sediminis]MBB5717887.1 hypothetical protein [Stakelama sediminis]
MSIPPETLMAYADGELDPIAAKRVEKAMAADPDLARQVAEHRALAEQLRGTFASVAEAPVPESLRAPLEASAKVASLDEARAPRSGRSTHWFRNAGALAAMLVVGVMVGQLVPHDGGPVAEKRGALVASGTLAHALNTQLAATQPEDAPVRMLVSFRDRQGAYCRTFAGSMANGIACHQGDGWRIRQLRAGHAEAATAYRQAGSEAAAVLADAQTMMAGAPLSADQEARARADHWR